MAGRRTFFFEGLAVSEGIAIGPAHVLESQHFKTDSYELTEGEVEQEVARFHRALELAKTEVCLIGAQVAEKIDRQQAAIFDAHKLMLEDPYLVDRTVTRIREEKINAESVFWAVTKALGEQMVALGDDYFAERNHDLYDVARRVIKHLTQLNAATQTEVPRDGCIIVSNDLGPAETAQFSRDHVLAFCTNEGGPTSHTAIMARSLAIPAVVGLEYVTHYVRSGDLLILDGCEGKVILNPSREQVEHYRRRAAEYAQHRLVLGGLRDLPATTTDGTRIELFANIEFPDELDAVESNGAEGIGLFRTEFLYMEAGKELEEDDHEREYRTVLDRMGEREVIIRTLDIGGDKLPSSEGFAHENNPFLGLRAVRLCLSRPALYRSQLRAILAAAAGRPVNIMIPMVCCVDEMRDTRRIVNDLLDRMRNSGEQCPATVRVGAMIEIPSAAIQAETLARECDFFSIGTNDLVQYTLAVDRVNKLVASLYQPAHPAVLKLIRMVVDAGNKANIPVSVCGEMASDPRLAILLIGLGIRKLSMGPSSIGSVKQSIRNASLAEASQLATEALTCSTAAEVEQLVRQRLGDMASISRTG